MRSNKIKNIFSILEKVGVATVIGGCVLLIIIIIGFILLIMYNLLQEFSYFGIIFGVIIIIFLYIGILSIFKGNEDDSIYDKLGWIFFSTLIFIFFLLCVIWLITISCC